MKSLIIVVVFLLFGCKESENTSIQKRSLIDIKTCEPSISIDKYGLVNKFYSNPDTVKLNASSFFIVSLYNCEGEMDFEEFNVDSGLVLKGHYKAAKKLTKGIRTNYNAAGEPSTDTTYSYYPIKAGIWEYYRNGKVIKTETHN